MEKAASDRHLFQSQGPRESINLMQNEYVACPVFTLFSSGITKWDYGMVRLWVANGLQGELSPGIALQRCRRFAGRSERGRRALRASEPEDRGGSR